MDAQGIEVLRQREAVSLEESGQAQRLLTSMLQTVMQLSRQSRTTSYSISFHPFIDFSTRTCELVAKAFVHSSTSSGSL